MAASSALATAAAAAALSAGVLWTFSGCPHPLAADTPKAHAWLAAPAHTSAASAHPWLHQLMVRAIHGAASVSARMFAHVAPSPAVTAHLLATWLAAGLAATLGRGPAAPIAAVAGAAALFSLHPAVAVEPLCTPGYTEELVSVCLGLGLTLLVALGLRSGGKGWAGAMAVLAVAVAAGVDAPTALTALLLSAVLAAWQQQDRRQALKLSPSTLLSGSGSSSTSGRPCATVLLCAVLSLLVVGPRAWLGGIRGTLSDLAHLALHLPAIVNHSSVWFLRHVQIALPSMTTTLSPYWDARSLAAAVPLITGEDAAQDAARLASAKRVLGVGALLAAMGLYALVHGGYLLAPASPSTSSSAAATRAPSPAAGSEQGSSGQDSGSASENGFVTPPGVSPSESEDGAGNGSGSGTGTGSGSGAEDGKPKGKGGRSPARQKSPGRRRTTAPTATATGEVAGAGEAPLVAPLAGHLLGQGTESPASPVASAGTTSYSPASTLLLGITLFYTLGMLTTGTIGGGSSSGAAGTAVPTLSNPQLYLPALVGGTIAASALLSMLHQRLQQASSSNGPALATYGLPSLLLLVLALEISLSARYTRVFDSPSTLWQHVAVGPYTARSPMAHLKLAQMHAQEANTRAIALSSNITGAAAAEVQQWNEVAATARQRLHALAQPSAPEATALALQTERAWTAAACRLAGSAGPFSATHLPTLLAHPDTAAGIADSALVYGEELLAEAAAVTATGTSPADAVAHAQAKVAATRLAAMDAWVRALELLAVAGSSASNPALVRTPRAHLLPFTSASKAALSPSVYGRSTTNVNSTLPLIALRLGDSFATAGLTAMSARAHEIGLHAAAMAGDAGHVHSRAALASGLVRSVTRAVVVRGTGGVPPVHVPAPSAPSAADVSTALTFEGAAGRKVDAMAAAAVSSSGAVALRTGGAATRGVCVSSIVIGTKVVRRGMPVTMPSYTAAVNQLRHLLGNETAAELLETAPVCPTPHQWDSACGKVLVLANRAAEAAVSAYRGTVQAGLGCSCSGAVPEGRTGAAHPVEMCANTSSVSSRGPVAVADNALTQAVRALVVEGVVAQHTTSSSAEGGGEDSNATAAAAAHWPPVHHAGCGVTDGFRAATLPTPLAGWLHCAPAGAGPDPETGLVGGLEPVVASRLAKACNGEAGMVKAAAALLGMGAEPGPRGVTLQRALVLAARAEALTLLAARYALAGAPALPPAATTSAAGVRTAAAGDLAPIPPRALSQAYAASHAPLAALVEACGCE